MRISTTLLAKQAIASIIDTLGIIIIITINKDLVVANTGKVQVKTNYTVIAIASHRTTQMAITIAIGFNTA